MPTQIERVGISEIARVLHHKKRLAALFALKPNREERKNAEPSTRRTPLYETSCYSDFLLAVVPDATHAFN